MSRPSLATEITGVRPSAPAATLTRRVHLLSDKPPPRNPQAAPSFPPLDLEPGPAPTTEDKMPKGVYDRSKAKPRTKTSRSSRPHSDGGSGGTANEVKPRKGKKAARKPAARPADRQPGDARFVVDDRGGMSIQDGQQEIKLERRDVERLAQFLERTKSIRAAGGK